MVSKAFALKTKFSLKVGQQTKSYLTGTSKTIEAANFWLQKDEINLPFRFRLQVIFQRYMRRIISSFPKASDSHLSRSVELEWAQAWAQRPGP